MLQGDKGDRPQLVHKHIYPPLGPSRLGHLLSFLGRKPRSSEDAKRGNDEAIADAYGFVSHNYGPGDQVILLTSPRHEQDPLIEAMEILARHLHDGTTPGEPSEAQTGGGMDSPARRIPIHAVAAELSSMLISTGDISLINDKLKSRSPPGIQHIISYGWSDEYSWGCSTVIDLDGGIVSREISMYETKYQTVDQMIHTTKDIIYYKSEKIPDWDKPGPIWIKVTDSPPSMLSRKPPSSTLPAGMYQHEWKGYEGEQDYSNRVVWKSTRH
ncbi:unnamed protein product [Rhizoctonia solani]|uniref:Uncharacterized protein n=1 Tax=Rhizoctonia solani TaxID=456999 RepID=A0A8H3HDS8_9AGAM|nr:unnamed protein product [Rhizoctonia solani]